MPLVTRTNPTVAPPLQNVTKSLYVCIYHDMRTNGVELPLTVLQNINTYVNQVQRYAEQNLGMDVAPDQVAGGLSPQAIAELGYLPSDDEEDLRAMRIMGLSNNDDDEEYDA